MATFTPNYNLRKPAGGDLVTVSTDINASMDIIDAELDDHEDRLDLVEAAEQFVHKTADETVTNSAALQNDDHLVVTLTAGTYTYEVVAHVRASGSGQDIKFTMDFGGTNSLHVYGATTLDEAVVGTSNVGVTFRSVLTDAAELVGGLGTAEVMIIVKGMLVATATSTLRFRWAQNTAGAATDTTVRAGSYMITKKVA